MHWLDTAESWEWVKRCWAIVLRGAGVCRDDRIVFLFSFGPFLGFWAAYETALTLGNCVFPAGGMTTSARLRYILDHSITVLCCTPTYAMRMAEVAEKDSVEMADSAVRLVIVAGEPGGNIPAVRKRIESAFGARVIDHAGMTEIGPWGLECEESPGGMHIIESEFIAEVIDPKTLRTVSEGTLGELVLTNLGRWGSPLIRYRTGDMVTLTRGRCACGRWFARVAGGILGRADDMLLIRGNNVFPSAIEAIIREVPEISEYRIIAEVVGVRSQLRIEIEPKDSRHAPRLVDRVTETVRNRLHFRPEVVSVSPGTLPRFEMKARRVERVSR